MRRSASQNEAVELSPFGRLAVAHALAVGGDALVTMALAGSLFFDISPGAARGRVALSLVLTMAPFAVVAPFLGPALDRRTGGRRLMLVLAAAGRVVACLAMARVIDNLLLFPAAFCTLVLSKTHAVTKSAFVPLVVHSEDELVEKNAKLALAGAAAGVVAAVPGVVVLKLASAEAVLWVAAVVFAVAAVAATRVRPVRRDDVTRRPAAAEELSDAGIRLAAVATAVLRAAVGFTTFLLAFALRRDGAPAWVFGLVLAAGTVGSSAGAALAPLARRAMREEVLLTAAAGLVGAGALGAAQLGGRPAAVLIAATVGIAAAAGKLAFDALVQRDAPDAVQGRQFARFEARFQLAWVAGALAPVALAVPQGSGLVLLATTGFTTAVGYGLARRG